MATLNAHCADVYGAASHCLYHREKWLKKSVVLTMVFMITSNSIGESQPSDFQARCATEAQKLFREAGHDTNVSPLTSPIAPVSRHYQSHYNTSLKKCLMLLEENQYVANQVATSATLIDTDDRYLYAFYLYVWSSEEDKEGNSPAMCELRPDLQTKIQCDGRKEFDAFVGRYMEN